MTSPTPRSSNVPSPGAASPFRNAVRAAVGMPLFLVGHLARRRHVRSSFDTVEELCESPPDPRPGDMVQSRDHGVGPLVLRRYEVELSGSTVTSDELMRRLIADPNLFVPTAVAGFVRDDAAIHDLVVGERLVIELPGPWNGPMRVDRADETELLLSTLEGHLEAGAIRFDVTGSSEAHDSYLFRITSWARAGDRAFKFLHLTIPIGREIQTAMWIGMCRKAAKAAGVPAHRLVAMTEILAESEIS